MISTFFNKVSVGIQLRFDKPLIANDDEDYTNNLKLSIIQDSEIKEIEIKKTSLSENN